jgi:uroporphyrinogen-III synthase
MSDTDVGHGALRGQRVLVPRTPDRAGELVTLLRSAGAEVVALPLIRIAAPADPAALDLSLVTLAKGGYSWVGFTSVSAVAAVLDRATELALQPPISADTRVAAVGPATEAALRARGVPVDLVPATAGSAEELAAAWPHGGDQTVLLPRSDLAAPALPEALAAKGYRVDDVTAYRTEPLRPPDDVADDLRSGRITAVLFTSPSTVTALDGLKIAAGTALGAIGRPTAAAVQKSGRRLDFVADRPTARALVDGLNAAVQRPQSDRTTTDEKQHRRVEA